MSSIFVVVLSDFVLHAGDDCFVEVVKFFGVHYIFVALVLGEGIRISCLLALSPPFLSSRKLLLW